MLRRDDVGTAREASSSMVKNASRWRTRSSGRAALLSVLSEESSLVCKTPCRDWWRTLCDSLRCCWCANSRAEVLRRTTPLKIVRLSIVRALWLPCRESRHETWLFVCFVVVELVFVKGTSSFTGNGDQPKNRQPSPWRALTFPSRRVSYVPYNSNNSRHLPP